MWDSSEQEPSILYRWKDPEMGLVPHWTDGQLEALFHLLLCLSCHFHSGSQIHSLLPFGLNMPNFHVIWLLLMLFLLRGISCFVDLINSPSSRSSQMPSPLYNTAPSPNLSSHWDPTVS